LTWQQKPATTLCWSRLCRNGYQWHLNVLNIVATVCLSRPRVASGSITKPSISSYGIRICGTIHLAHHLGTNSPFDAIHFINWWAKCLFSFSQDCCLLSGSLASHTGSASDWCSLQEALYKCIDTMQCNTRLWVVEDLKGAIEMAGMNENTIHYNCSKTKSGSVQYFVSSKEYLFNKYW